MYSLGQKRSLKGVKGREEPSVRNVDIYYMWIWEAQVSRNGSIKLRGFRGDNKKIEMFPSSYRMLDAGLQLSLLKMA